MYVASRTLITPSPLQSASNFWSSVSVAIPTTYFCNNVASVTDTKPSQSTSQANPSYSQIKPLETPDVEALVVSFH